MSATPSREATRAKKGVRIFINGEPYVAPERRMTGLELLKLAGLPETNQLFLDVPGDCDDEPVDVDECVGLRPGMKFYDVPVGTFG